MNAIRVTLNLFEPVLISSSSGDPNTNAGLNYIPGSSLRGAFMQLFRNANPDDDVEKLFLNNKVQFLNAYPVSSNGKRCLPAPRSWFSPKSSLTHDICDFSLEDTPDKTQNWKSSITTGSFIEIYSSEDEEEKTNVLLEKVSMGAQIHNQRSNQSGSDEDQAVFRYLPISPYQAFEAVILVDDPVLKETLLNFSEEEIFIGRSHTANYGRVFVEMEVDPNWVEANEKPIDDRIVVTLLSDMILRNQITGNVCLDPEEWFSQPPFSAKLQKCFINPRIIAGFNRTWGLPTPQVNALSAGSVLVFDMNADFLNVLREHQKNGLGERCEEGFGRFAINMVPYSDIVIRESARPDLPSELELTGESADIALQISESILHQELDPYLYNAIHRISIQDPPSNSQLSRLGEALKRARRVENPMNELSNHLGSLKNIGKNQFKAARFDKNTPFYDWLECSFTNPTEIWEVILANNVNPRPVGKQFAKKDDLAIEYLIRFLDGLIRKTRKEK